MDDERYAISDTVQYLVELCDVKLQQPARRQTTPSRQRAGVWLAGWLAGWLSVVLGTTACLSCLTFHQVSAVSLLH